MKYYLAIDIGASSGRHIVGWREDEKICTEELYRFPNFADHENGHLVWNLERLFHEVLHGIAKAFEKYPRIESLAIDTWGVDYVLMHGEQAILPCYCYRDARTQPLIEEVHDRMPFSSLYARTGTQFQPFNTLYQLYADSRCGRLEQATAFLMLPEYLNFRLTGTMKKEYTNATTSGLVNAASKAFDAQIIQALALPAHLFTELSQPGDAVGELLPDVVAKVGGNTKVVLCASHDTASAFESLDFERGALILSSGTWSLLGLKCEEANRSEASRQANFTNEGGVGCIRFLKNIAGLWVIGQLRKEFGLDYAQAEKAAKASGFASVFDINDPAFTAPASMSAAIQSWFLREGLAAPERQGDLLNAAYHSLAESYRQAICEIEAITAKTYDKIYIIGGGAKDCYLNALTTRRTKKEIAAMPMEATAIGNLRVQMRTEEP